MVGDDKPEKGEESSEYEAPAVIKEPEEKKQEPDVKVPDPPTNEPENHDAK